MYKTLLLPLLSISCFVASCNSTVKPETKNTFKKTDTLTSLEIKKDTVIKVKDTLDTLVIIKKEEVVVEEIDTNIITVKAKFMKFNLGDAEHYNFIDESNNYYSFNRNNSSHGFARIIEDKKLIDHHNQGWTSNADYQFRWFNVSYETDSAQLYIDGPIGEIYIITNTELLPMDKPFIVDSNIMESDKLYMGGIVIPRVIGEEKNWDIVNKINTYFFKEFGINNFEDGKNLMWFNTQFNHTINNDTLNITYSGENRSNGIKYIEKSLSFNLLNGDLLSSETLYDSKTRKKIRP